MKLNQYTEATSFSDSDIFPIMQSDILKKGTIQTLKDSLGGGVWRYVTQTHLISSYWIHLEIRLI